MFHVAVLDAGDVAGTNYLTFRLELDGGLTRYSSATDDNPVAILDDDSVVTVSSLASGQRWYRDGGKTDLPYAEIDSATASGWYIVHIPRVGNGIVFPDGGVVSSAVLMPAPKGSFDVVNGVGQAVGFFQLGLRGPSTWNRVVYDQGRIVTMSVSDPVVNEWALDMSQTGYMTGAQYVGGRNAAVYRCNETVRLPQRTSWSTEGLAINNLGVAVGVEYQVNAGPNDPESRAFVYAHGTYLLLDDLFPDAGYFFVRPNDINDQNTVVGEVIWDDIRYAFRLRLSIDAGL